MKTTEGRALTTTQLKRLAKQANAISHLRLSQQLPSDWFEQLKQRYGTITEAAKTAGCGESSIYRWSTCERIPFHGVKLILTLL